jgi:NADPH:quinone reductase-like Zn-dependent oxidoreductase
MKAIRITQNGDASVLQVQSLPQPKPGNGEALVRLIDRCINNFP